MGFKQIGSETDDVLCTLQSFVSFINRKHEP